MSQAEAEPSPAHADSYLTAQTSVGSWLLSTDHKRIGILYFFATTLALLLGGAFALLMRIEHLSPGPTIMGAMTYNRLFTLHGITMVWLFMIPSIPAALGNFLLPLQIGATEVAFPRLNLLSFWIFVLGAVFMLVSLWLGALDTGWTFYAPYSDNSPSAVVPTVLGIFIVGWSTIITGINFIATVHTMRARGVTWMRLPLFTWALYGTSIIQVLATPVLGLSLLIVVLDHAFGWGVFDAARGGDPLLFQHLFWFYSHPAVYIMILPAMGVVSEIVSSFAHKNPYSYKAIVYSTLGIAFVGFLT
jgi:cytochrome c oxidase subunit 1